MSRPPPLLGATLGPPAVQAGGRGDAPGLSPRSLPAEASAGLRSRCAGLLQGPDIPLFSSCPRSCEITTREYCEFMHGYFHEEATLCSQVG